MAKGTDNFVDEIKENKIIYGAETTIKQAKKNNVEKVYITIDCHEDIEKKLRDSKLNIIKLTLTKEALKELCKKPFNISVLAIIKEKSGKEENKKEKESKKKSKEK